MGVRNTSIGISVPSRRNDSSIRNERCLSASALAMCFLASTSARLATGLNWCGDFGGMLAFDIFQAGIAHIAVASLDSPPRSRFHHAKRPAGWCLRTARGTFLRTCARGVLKARDVILPAPGKPSPRAPKRSRFPPPTNRERADMLVTKHADNLATHPDRRIEH